MTDWVRWHDDYADPASPLSRRLALVQQHIASWLDATARAAVRVVSLCAGQGHDLLGVLAPRPDAVRVSACLVEADARNVEQARATVRAAALGHVEVRQADAAELATYADVVPADLLLAVGVFGNISDSDVERTVNCLPQLCASGATVIWTRHRREPDLTPSIRRWLVAAGFVEEAFHAPDDVLFSVGVARLAGRPQPLAPAGRMFTFVR